MIWIWIKQQQTRNALEIKFNLESRLALIKKV